MGIKTPLARQALGFIGAFGLTLWRKTIDWKAVYCDPTVDTVHPGCTQRNVYAGWHEVMLMPISLRGHRDVLALASEHGDGDIVGRAMRHLGWGVVRGSSTRGGVSALLKLLREDHRHINITPDGPKGPRRTMSSGPLFLASKLGLPLVCVGYGFERPWRMRSWDRFAVPRPFSRARAVFGPPLRLPAKLDRDAMEGHRLWFERLLNWLTEDAEAWAESGQRRSGEAPMIVGAAPPALLKWHPKQAPHLPAWLHTSWTALGNRPIEPVAASRVTTAAA